MPQKSIIGRMASLARTDVHALLDRADVPAHLLDQMVRDYTNVISNADMTIVATLAELRTMEQDAREKQAAAVLWETKADAAGATAAEMRSAGRTADADVFDDLARAARQNQSECELDARSLAISIADQTDTVTKVKDGLAEMLVKLNELRQRRSALFDRPADADHPPVEMNIFSPTEEIDRFDEKIRAEHARIREDPGSGSS